MLLAQTKVHFVGVGGVGMSALAKVLVEAGHQVSGSDLKESEFTTSLRAAGARIDIGHRAENVGDADLVVISSAVPQTNPEVQQALAAGIKVIKRAELLGEFTRKLRSIAVAGTHGKTTVSSMVGFVLEYAGLDPTLLVGGEVTNLGTNAKLGLGPFLVAEADEFDGSFLRLSPWAAIVTNVEADHLDFYPDFEAIQKAFGAFMTSVAGDGHLFVCADDPYVRDLARGAAAALTTYGFDSSSDWTATNVAPNGLGGNDFDVLHHQQHVAHVSLRVPGRHNVQNALATMAVAYSVAIDPEKAAEALGHFIGAKRRFEHRGTVNGIAVFDDYGHHPTEIRATLAAAREQRPATLWCVFQPHTYNRTKQLWDDFLTAFDQADRVVMCDVYSPAGREADTWGVNSERLVTAMQHAGAVYAGDLEAASGYVCDRARPGDMVITMGAGSIHQAADMILAGLRTKSGERDDGPR